MESVFHLLTCLELYEGVLIPPLALFKPASSGEVCFGPLLLGDSNVIENKIELVIAQLSKRHPTLTLNLTWVPLALTMGA